MTTFALLPVTKKISSLIKLLFLCRRQCLNILHCVGCYNPEPPPKPCMSYEENVNTHYHVHRVEYCLTNRGRDRMAHVLQKIFSDAFCWKKMCILIQISLQFLPEGSNSKHSTLVQRMAWCQTSTKPLSKSVMTYYWCIYSNGFMQKEM